MPLVIDLSDLGDAGGAKVQELHTARLCAEFGGASPVTPIALSAGARAIPITIVPVGYQATGMNPKTPVDVMVEGNASLTEAAIQAVSVGGTSPVVNSFIIDTDNSATIATMKCNVEHLADVAALVNVTGLYLSPLVRPQMDMALGECMVRGAWGGVPPGPYSKFTGKDVIIGVIDTGLYVQHGDFKKPDGTTRVLVAWDMTAVGTPPTGFSYGKEYSQAAIQTEADKTFPTISTVLEDRIGHGTPVTSIACGNGAEVGAAPHRYKYVGVAPEADIIVVKLPEYPTEANLIDAVNFVFGKAGGYSPAKRAVALVTATNNRGAHDGSSTLDRAMSNLCTQDRIVVAAAGNYGTDPDDGYNAWIGPFFHVKSTLPTVSAAKKTWMMVVSRYGSVPMSEFVLLEGWITGSEQYTVEVFMKRGVTEYGPVTATHGQDVTSTIAVTPLVATRRTATVRIRNNVQTNPTGTKKKIEIYISNEGGQEFLPLGPLSGTQGADLIVRVTRTGGAGTVGVIDWFVADAIVAGKSNLIDTIYTEHPNYGVTDMTVEDATTLASPSSGDKVICVGAFRTRTSWPNSTGGTTQEGPPNDPLNLYANRWIPYYSGEGPRLGETNDFRPDVVAPGEWIVAAMSDQKVPAANSSAIADSLWHVSSGDYIAGGTSLAAAFVAGAIALMFHKYGTLSPADVRGVLRAATVADSYTGVTPNNRAGYGKINLINMGSTTSVDPIIPPPGGGGGDEPPTDPVIVRARPGRKNLDPDTGVVSSRTSFFDLLDAAPVAGEQVQMTVYNSSYEPVRTLSREFSTDGEASFIWDHTIDGGAPAVAGDYVVRFSYGNKSHVSKVAL